MFCLIGKRRGITNIGSVLRHSRTRHLHSLLSDRSIIRAAGQDSEKLLQNLTTNDIKKVSVGQGQLTAFLHPQGRTIAFAFLYRIEKDDFLIDVDQNVVQDLLAAIKRFKLRSKITLEDKSEEFGVMSKWGDEQDSTNLKSLISIQDPRSPNMGTRSIIAKQDHQSTEEHFKAYTVHRIIQGIPETVEEIVVGGMPLEANLDLMGGVDFRKGCYIGQELTARTHHTGVIRKRIVPISLSSNQDDLTKSNEIQHVPNTQFEQLSSVKTTGIEVRSHPINSSTPSRGKSAGKLLSCIDNLGLAMLRLEQVDRWNKDFTMKVLVGEKPIFVRPFIPNWWPEDVKQQP